MAQAEPGLGVPLTDNAVYYRNSDYSATATSRPGASHDAAVVKRGRQVLTPLSDERHGSGHLPRELRLAKAENAPLQKV